jgi:hypothetical protein
MALEDSRAAPRRLNDGELLGIMEASDLKDGGSALKATRHSLLLLHRDNGSPTIQSQVSPRLNVEIDRAWLVVTTNQHALQNLVRALIS